MKRHAAALIQFLLLFTAVFLNFGSIPCQAIMGMDVVINEFNPNPLSGPQWVELFNPAGFAQDVSLWRITTYSTGIIRTIPFGALMGPKGYLIVDLLTPIIDPIADRVILVDRNGLEIDRTALLSKQVKDGNAWARFPNGIDTNSVQDWKLQPATKGTSNDAPTPPVTPTIACTLSSVQVPIGSSVTVRVLIGPPRSAPVTIQVKGPGDLDWSNLTTALTEASGLYVYPWTPDVMGEYSVRAYVYPTLTFPGMYSLVINFVVTKIPTQISCFVTRLAITLGQDLATYGYVIPAIDDLSITLTYRKPTGDPIVRQVLTGSGGLYNDTSFTPQEVGSWNVTASWEGDETHTSATSPLTRFNVEQPPAPPFGMWLIVAVVVSVTVAAVVLGVGHTRSVVPKPARRVALCPQCRSTLLYVPSIRGWYCPNCRRYI